MDLEEALKLKEKLEEAEKEISSLKDTSSKNAACSCFHRKLL